MIIFRALPAPPVSKQKRTFATIKNDGFFPTKTIEMKRIMNLAIDQKDSRFPPVDRPIYACRFQMF
jgi:hypothetical protein